MFVFLPDEHVAGLKNKKITKKHSGDELAWAVNVESLDGIHTWKMSEISKGLHTDRFALQYGALRFGRPDFSQLNQRLTHDKRLIRLQAPFGSLALLEGYAESDENDKMARGVRKS